MSLARNTSMTVVARLLVTGAAALSALVVASTLGAKGAGTFAQVRVLPTVIAALLGGGVTIATPYLIGARRYPVQAITETSMALALGLSVVGCAAWLLCGTLLHAHIYTELSQQAALCVGLAIPLQLLSNYLNSIQQGMQSFKDANLVLLVDEIASLVLVLPLLAGFPGGTTLIVVAAVGGSVISTLTAVVLLWRRGIRPRVWLHRPIAVEAIQLGLKGHVGRIANMLNWRLDLMILSGFASVEVVGCYAVASKVAELFRPLSASLTFVLRPVIASLPIGEARARGVLLYRRFFLINLAAIVVMVFAGPPIILHAFGAEFAPAVPAFLILLVGLAAHGADGVINGYNVGIGRPELNSYTALVGLAVTVVGDLALIPPYSLVGAAIASSAAYTVKAIALTAIFLATSGVSIRQLAGVEEYVPDAV
jgi:O-antigen/teichoic acid export membrane protein